MVSLWNKMLKFSNWLALKSIRKIGGVGRVDYVSEYDKIHTRLVENEEVLKQTIYGYCTGGDVKMSDVDEVFKNMKSNIREVRKLALEARDEKEIHPE